MRAMSASQPEVNDRALWAIGMGQSAVHDVILALRQLVSHNGVDQEECAPQASQATVERTKEHC